MPSSIPGTIFNRCRLMIESWEVGSNFSKIYFFLAAITDKSKGINQYMNNVSIFPVDITQYQLNDWTGTLFGPSKPDWFGLVKNTMADAVINCLKHMKSRIVTLPKMRMACLQKKRSRCLLTGFVRIKNVFHHRSLNSHTDLCFRDPL